MLPIEAYAEAKKWHNAFGFVPPELEEIIASDAYYSLWYAKYVIKGRFKLGEAVIATDKDYSFNYALYGVEDRFVLGEACIATSAYYSYMYAKFVIKGRFELGEPAIFSFTLKIAGARYDKVYINFLSEIGIEL